MAGKKIGTDEKWRSAKVEGHPGIYASPKGWYAKLSKREDGNFRLVYSEGIIETLDSQGRLIKLQDRNNNRMEFYYNISGQLASVMDSMGRMIDFEYYPFECEMMGSGVLSIVIGNETDR